ncbi:MAG: P-II family nitrogen regulator [Clostridiales bacterium]|jgi:nitrogen regulatory protein PII 2|nr:P-II family nitrogen regulator [Clostridiales bacterium]
MREIIAIIRMGNVGKTKAALEKAGFPGLTCRKVLGRGKKAADYVMASGKPVLNENGALSGELVSLAARVGQIHTLMPKRLFTIIVRDEDSKRAVDAILDANSTGKAGDGKIFVIEIDEVVAIRTLERGEGAV